MASGRKVRSLKDRFWAKVKKTKSCWVWTGYCAPNGYGKINLCDTRQKVVAAHRLSWEWANGKDIPNGLYILHSCDNPPCVNPKHLFLGTQQDNVKDRERKGRGNQPINLQNGKAKHSNETVLAIRALAGRHTYKELSNLFNVPMGTIHGYIHSTRRTYL